MHKDIFDKHQKKPKKGGGFALKVPGRHKPDFPRLNVTCLSTRTNAPHFDQVSEELNEWIQFYCPKSVIFAILGLFWPLLSPWSPYNIFVNQRVSLFNLSKITTSCKMSDNFNGWPQRKIRTNRQTGLKTIVPLR